MSDSTTLICRLPSASSIACSVLYFRKVTLNEIHTRSGIHFEDISGNDMPLIPDSDHGDLTPSTTPTSTILISGCKKTIAIIDFRQLVAGTRTVAIGPAALYPDIVKMLLHPAITG